MFITLHFGSKKLFSTVQQMLNQCSSEFMTLETDLRVMSEMSPNEIELLLYMCQNVTVWIIN